MRSEPSYFCLVGAKKAPHRHSSVIRIGWYLQYYYTFFFRNKDGAELKIDGKHFEYRTEEAEDSLTLVLNKATKDDAGTYSCTISNSVGSETTSSKLEIKGNGNRYKYFCIRNYFTLKYYYSMLFRYSKSYYKVSYKNKSIKQIKNKAY